MDEDRILNNVIENNDTESIFTSLNKTQDKPMEINDNNVEEDVSNNENDSSSVEDSTNNR